MKILIITLSLLFLLVSLNGSDAGKERPCNVAYRCSTVDEPVWVTDGKSCQVLRNGCFLLAENCNRQNNYEPELKEIPKEKCQELCGSVCPDNYKPVCGYYNDKKKTFANECEMTNYVCKTGQTYNLFRLGACE